MQHPDDVPRVLVMAGQVSKPSPHIHCTNRLCCSSTAYKQKRFAFRYEASALAGGLEARYDT